MAEVYLILGMAAVTFGIRYTMFAISGKVRFPNWLLNMLRYVPPAVLTAIITPAVFMPNGQSVNFSLSNAYLVGAVTAFIVGWFSHNLLLTIVSGMIVFWGWQWVLMG